MIKVTIRDVARHAGVGIGTVSRVLNDSPSVSDDTRRKVLAAIEELNYRPSTVARQLSAGGRHRAAGVIAPILSRPAAVERLRGIEAALRQEGYHSVLYNVESPEQLREVFRQVTGESRLDGIIVMGLPVSDAHIDALADAGLPAVTVDASHERLSGIASDDAEGGSIAVEHLVRLGHRRIAYLSERRENPVALHESDQHFTGYWRALMDHGLRFEPEYRLRGSSDRYSTVDLVQQVMALTSPPTAIFTASDMQAVIAINTLRELGLDTPGDVSVVGYGNTEMASYMGLTTIDQALYDIGRQAVSLLFAAMDRPADPPEHHAQAVRLVLRRSTGPAPD